MIAQNSSHMRQQINLYGCYYFALVWWAWFKAELEVDLEFLNEALYHKFIRSGWMTESCFILNPVKILGYLRVHVKSVSKEPAEYVPTDEDVVLIGQFKADGELSHFVPVDRSGRPLYDSWQSKEGGSKAVREGRLISWRVFRA